MSNTVTLKGGSHDGEKVVVRDRWQRVHVLYKRITLAEFDALCIDEVQAYKAPEEFYHRVGKTDVFELDSVVHYNPADLDKCWRRS